MSEKNIEMETGIHKTPDKIVRIGEDIEKNRFTISFNSTIYSPDTLKTEAVSEDIHPDRSIYYQGVYDSKENAEQAKNEIIKQQLYKWTNEENGETPYWIMFKKESGEINKHDKPKWVEKYGYEAYDPDPEFEGSKYWHIRKTTTVEK